MIVYNLICYTDLTHNKQVFVCKHIKSEQVLIKIRQSEPEKEPQKF